VDVAAVAIAVDAAAADLDVAIVVDAAAADFAVAIAVDAAVADEDYAGMTDDDDEDFGGGSNHLGDHSVGRSVSSGNSNSSSSGLAQLQAAASNDVAACAPLMDLFFAGPALGDK
jgi:hypothetical protein